VGGVEHPAVLVSVRAPALVAVPGRVQHGQPRAGAHRAHKVQGCEVWDSILVVFVQVIERDVGPVSLNVLLILSERAVTELEEWEGSTGLCTANRAPTNQGDDGPPSHRLLNRDGI